MVAGDVSRDADDFIREPWAYPGTPVRANGLLLKSELHSLQVPEGRRLGQARTSVGIQSRTLTQMLLEANSAAPDARYLVLAVGSNASAAVMQRKFRAAHVSTTTPFFVTVVQHLAVGHSAHVSAAGYVPAAGFFQQDRAKSLRASLLDPEQLLAVHRTEPNYTLRLLEPSLSEAILDSGEIPAGMGLFDTNHGVLARPTPDGAPANPLELRPQEELVRLLLTEMSGLSSLIGRSDPRMAMQRWSQSEALRLETRELFRTSGWVSPTGLAAAPPRTVTDAGTDLPRYGSMAPRQLIAQTGLRAVSSPDDSDRRGEQVVVVDPTAHPQLRSSSHVAVSSPQSPIRPVTARLLHGRIPPDAAGVDQLIRNSLGIELQESVVLEPVNVPWSPWADRFIAKPHFAVLRVQSADLSTVERDAVLIDPLAMKLMGLDEGDLVVVQGAPRDGTVPEVRLRAFSTPDVVRDRRERLSGGSLVSRFPSSADSLGVVPDLPWIFLDATVRRHLNLGSAKLSVVRARASRRFQVERELREILLVIALAIVGVATVIDDRTVMTLLILALVSASLWMVLQRVRRRLEVVGSKSPRHT